MMKAEPMCHNCKRADFRYNDAPVGSGRSTFLCRKKCEYKDYASNGCNEWEERK